MRGATHGAMRGELLPVAARKVRRSSCQSHVPTGGGNPHQVRHTHRVQRRLHATMRGGTHVAVRGAGATHGAMRGELLPVAARKVRRSSCQSHVPTGGGNPHQVRHTHRVQRRVHATMRGAVPGAMRKVHDNNQGQ